MRVEQAGEVVLPPGWSSGWEWRVASFVAHVCELPIRYESGSRVPPLVLARGWLRGT